MTLVFLSCSLILYHQKFYSKIHWILVHHILICTILIHLHEFYNFWHFLTTTIVPSTARYSCFSYTPVCVTLKKVSSPLKSLPFVKQHDISFCRWKSWSLCVYYVFPLDLCYYSVSLEYDVCGSGTNAIVAQISRKT